MTADGVGAMCQSRRRDGESKRLLVLAATDALLEAGRVPTIAGIARQARVGRKFIYDHLGLRAAIDLKIAQASKRLGDDLTASARVTGASLRAELENARAQNHRLVRQVQALENRLSRAEGVHLIADELLPQSVVSELADRQLAGRVEELAQQLFETKEALRCSVDELDAAADDQPRTHATSQSSPARRSRWLTPRNDLGSCREEADDDYGAAVLEDTWTRSGSTG